MSHVVVVLSSFPVAPSSPEMPERLTWDAVEESEHRTAAFNVYQQVCGDDRPEFHPDDPDNRAVPDAWRARWPAGT